MKTIIIISGVSGVGKSELIKQILQFHSDKFYLSISHTTRTPRPLELNDKDYYFISNAKFQTMIENNDFIEYDHHFNNYYGTSKNEIYRLNKTPILDIDTSGFMQIKKNKEFNILSFFLLLPEDILQEDRILNRASISQEELQMRLDKSKFELSAQDLYDYKIVNYNLQDTLTYILKIIC